MFVMAAVGFPNEEVSVKTSDKISEGQFSTKHYKNDKMKCSYKPVKILRRKVLVYHSHICE